MAVEAKEDIKAPEITEASIQEKAAKGETLSDAELEFLKGTPKEESILKVEGEPEPDDEPGEEIKVPKESKKKSAPKETEKKAPEPKKEEEPPKKEETTAPAKKEEPPAETKEQRQAKIEAELAKPDAQQDLTQFTDSELGTYWDLRKQRERNQALRTENEELKFRLTQKDLKEKAEKETKDDDALKDIDDEDIITGKQLKEILKKQAAKAPKPEAPQMPTPAEIKMQEDAADAELKSKGIEDYREVASYTQFALFDDPEAQAIIRDAGLKKQNVAKMIYSMIKGSKRWPIIKLAIEQERAKKTGGETKKTEPSTENLERQKRLEENEKKIKTTGGGGAGDEDSGEYTADEVRNMSIDEFRALPKATRELILKKWGSNPNQG